jgi:ParB-like chromosome segregation protein Spo0J
VELGFIRSVTVNRVTGHIVDGHERVFQALQAGQPTIDVEYVELSEADERKALAVLDRSAELAGIDADALNELLQATQFDDATLRKLVADLASDAELCLEPQGTLADAELGKMMFSILVECESEGQQAELLERFESEGLSCRAWIS